MNNRMLFFVLFVAYNAYSTEIWLHNGYGEPLMYKFNNQKEQTINAGTRIMLAVHERTARSQIRLYPAISNLDIKTTTKGSLYKSLLSKIKEVMTDLSKNNELDNQNAILFIKPSKFLWDITVFWVKPEETLGQAQQRELQKFAAFFRTQSAEQFFMSIIKDKILGVDYAQKTAEIYNAAYYNPNYKPLLTNILQAINSIKPTFGQISPDRQMYSLTVLKDIIDNNYKSYQLSQQTYR